MPFIIATITFIISGYLLYSANYLIGGGLFLFALGLLVNALPKRKIDFDDLVPSQHTSDKKRDRR